MATKHDITIDEFQWCQNQSINQSPIISYIGVFMNVCEWLFVLSGTKTDRYVDI